MEKNFSIGEKELECILINAIFSKMLFSYPRSLVEMSGNAAWIQVIFVSLISCLYYFFLIWLYKNAEMMSITQLCRQLGGKPLLTVVGTVLWIVLLINLSFIMRALPESLKTVVLPLTPLRLILLMSAVCIAFGSFFGLFSIARIHSVFVPVSVFFLFIMFLLLLPETESSNIFPILGKGTYNIFIGGLPFVSLFSDMILLFILLPQCESYVVVKKASKKALIISSVINIMIMLFYNLIYAYPLAEEFLLPIYQMTRLIKIGDFFQRLEAFFEFIRSFGVLLYASLYLYCISRVFADSVYIKYNKPLIPCFAVLASALSLIPKSYMGLVDIQNISYFLTIPVCFFLPLILILLKIKRDIKERKESK